MISGRYRRDRIIIQTISAEAIHHVWLRRILLCAENQLFQCVFDKVTVFFNRSQFTEVIWCVLIYKIEPVGIGAV